MSRYVFRFAIAVVVSTCALGEAFAQYYNPVLPGGTNGYSPMSSRAGSMFRGMAMGQSIPTPTKPGSPATPTFSGSEWLIQRAHGKGSFVGADHSDAANFVGAQQAEGDASPTGAAAVGAVTGARLGIGLNTPPPARKLTDLYYPQISVGFEFTAPNADDVSSTLARQLEQIPLAGVRSPIEVSVEGTTATLRGAVASERDRALMEQIALFEPGISSVRNLLTLAAPQAKRAAEPRPAK
jgi:hypothetical protein